MDPQQETTPKVAETTKRRKSYTAASDFDLNDLAVNIAQQWGQNPQITLLWTQSTHLGEAAQQFGVIMGERHSAGSQRTPVTATLAKLDKKINQHLDYLKTYLKDKFGKESYMDYFGQFGIVKTGRNYIFPTDRNRRKASLQQAVAALQAHNFEGKTYGIAFWQEILTQYEQLLSTSVSADSNVAGLVSAKNQYRAQILKTLNALIYAIKANYPDDYQSVMRAWGFQKEKY